MTTKEAIHQLIDTLDEEAARTVLVYIESIAGGGRRDADRDADTDIQSKPLEWMKIGQPTSEDDPLWRIVGMVGDEYDGPTDVARNHDRYLADAYADWKRE